MTAAAISAPTPPPMTRREFLYYIWGASMALFMAELGGAMVWFALPRFRAGEFGGVFTLDISKIPPVDSDPQDNPGGRFWLVNIGEKRISDPRQPQDYPVKPGVVAIYKVCVHLGCLYKWVPVNDRFECPCHGSKYLATYCCCWPAPAVAEHPRLHPAARSKLGRRAAMRWLSVAVLPQRKTRLPWY